MARRVFFSFHYQRDIFRANVVRNSWVTQDREAAGFWDASLWEEAQKQGDAAIRKMIDEGLKNTSVTAVLIGKETSGREWVRYEVRESHKRGNGLLGVYIHGIKDIAGLTDAKGDNQFGEIGKDVDGKSIYFWQLYPTYDWIEGKGYENFGAWVEKAAKAAGR
jgi:hypothetical protein